MRVAITGGTGFLGRHLTSYLGALGHDLVLIQRSDLKGGPDQISKLIKTSDVLINLAGSPVIKRWNSSNKLDIRDSRIHTTNLLVEALVKLPLAERPSLFISASAIGIYDSVKLHTENSAHFDDNFLATVCKEWEACLDPIKKTNIRLCLIRIGIVLAEDGGMLGKLVPLFKMAIGGKIGSGKQPFSFIHYHDFCRVVEFLIDHSQCEGIFNLTAPDISNNEDFTKILAQTCGCPAFFTVPEFALKMIYGEAAVTMILGQSVYPQHLIDCGFNFRYPDLESAIQEIMGESKKEY
jgi:hypothetical protein